ncbi:MAG: hypothetical protein NTZ16_14370, partial [Verrucomicrobia bacterium]|nr:hypothetical protein [Verrucomicrobiota bacterium]
NTTPTGDADGDGLLNIGEFALGTSPIGGSSTNDPTAALDGQHRLALTFSRDPALTDFVYEVEATSDLGGAWTVIARSTGGNATVDVGGNTSSVVETVTGARRQVVVTDPSTATRRFLRLKITPPANP